MLLSLLLLFYLTPYHVLVSDQLLSLPSLLLFLLIQSCWFITILIFQKFLQLIFNITVERMSRQIDKSLFHPDQFILAMQFLKSSLLFPFFQFLTLLIDLLNMKDLVNLISILIHNLLVHLPHIILQQFVILGDWSHFLFILIKLELMIILYCLHVFSVLQILYQLSLDSLYYWLLILQLFR